MPDVSAVPVVPIANFVAVIVFLSFHIPYTLSAIRGSAEYRLQDIMVL